MGAAGPEHDAWLAEHFSIDLGGGVPTAPSEADLKREEEFKIRALAARIPERVDTFLEMWVRTLDEAISEVPPPKIEDPTGTTNFYVALLGNLAWAATCLIPEAKGLVVAMSFGGATVGSGAAAQDPVEQPPTPIIALHARFNAMRDQISAKMRSDAINIATEIIGDSPSGQKEEDEALWSRLFPGAKFNSSAELAAANVKVVTSACNQYTAQFKAWNKDIEGRTILRLNEMTPRWRSPDDHAAVMIGAYETTRRAVALEKPFSPKLSF